MQRNELVGDLRDVVGAALGHQSVPVRQPGPAFAVADTGHGRAQPALRLNLRIDRVEKTTMITAIQNSDHARSVDASRPL